MDDLIAIVRTYIEDTTTPYTVSDAIITRWLNKDRGYVNSLQIFAEDYYYDNESLVYQIGYKYLSGVVLKDGDDNTISSSNYTVDVFNGIVTFDDGYTIPDAVYITFNWHDFFEAVAELWLYQAGLSRFSGRVKLADEDLPMDKSSREYCIQKSWTYRQSKNIQMER
jgi:hypothetical protein